MNTIGERIKWLRKERCKLTQEIVGRYVGVGKATINKYENGIITNIPSDKIMLLAEILETTPSFLMGWSENPERFIKNNNQKSEDEKLNEEIIRLFSSLSHGSKLRVLAYAQGLKDSEETKEAPSSAQ